MEAEYATPKYFSFGIRIIQSRLFKEVTNTGEGMKPRSYPFEREIYVYKGNLHLSGCLPLCTRKSRMTESVEALIREDTYLSLHNKPCPCLLCFSCHLPLTSSLHILEYDI